MPAAPVLRNFVQYLIAFYSRPQTVNDVISIMAVQYVGMDECVKFGDSMSNRSRDIRLPQFVMNDD